MIYVVTSDVTPVCFFKANSSEEALKKFRDPGNEGGWVHSDIANHPSLSAVPLTLEMLEKLAPDEFMLTDVDF